MLAASFHPADCPAADRVCAEVLSLPLYPGLPFEAASLVAAAVRDAAVASGGP